MATNVISLNVIYLVSYILTIDIKIKACSTCCLGQTVVNQILLTTNGFHNTYNSPHFKAPYFSYK